MKQTSARFETRTWLAWLVKVRPLLITVLLTLEVLIVTLTRNNVPAVLFATVIVLWYTISVFFYLLYRVSADYEMQARVQVVTDVVMSTAVLYVTGGIDTSFNFLLPLVIIMACILLSRWWAYLIAALAFIGFGALLELTYFDLLHGYSINRPDLRSLQIVIFINLFAYLAVAYLGSMLSEKLRQVDTELADKSGMLVSLRALHENVIQSMQGGLITTDLAGRITLINRAGEALIGHPADDLLGRNIQSLFAHRLPDTRNDAVHTEMRFVSTQGKQKIFAITASPLDVPDIGRVGVLYAVEDQTQMRRLEREVRLRDRLSAVGRMASGIAHEIRNPLSSIAGAVAMLTDVATLNEDQRTLLRIVTKESERLNAIISEFLLYSREKKYSFIVMDVRLLIEETLTLLKQSLPEERTIVVEQGLCNDPALCLVDEDKIRQVFWNICQNAIRAMPEGGALRVTVDADHEYVQMTFADTGRGIAPEMLDRIFEPFQTGFDAGTGLGLAICYQIVQAHDGNLTVRSKKGAGTSFQLSLKRAVQPIVAEPELHAESAHG